VLRDPFREFRWYPKWYKLTPYGDLIRAFDDGLEVAGVAAVTEGTGNPDV
jgi:hypothetical protein